MSNHELGKSMVNMQVICIYMFHEVSMVSDVQF